MMMVVNTTLVNQHPKFWLGVGRRRSENARRAILIRNIPQLSKCHVMSHLHRAKSFIFSLTFSPRHLSTCWP